MGILGYPNNDDKNTGDYSADLSNFQDDGIQNVDLVDAFPESEDLSFEQQAAVAADIPLVEQSVAQGDMSQAAQGNNEQPMPTATKNSGGGIMTYILLMALLVVAVGAYIFVNKPFGGASEAPQEQVTGDYFYDQALNSGATDTAQQPPANETLSQNTLATVDVVLDEPAQPAAPANEKSDKVAASTQQKAVPAEVKKAPLNAYEKAMAKKAVDEVRTEQLGLNNANGEVVIPVNAGGRLDPFLPSGVMSAFVDKPKFDIIAPPPVVPETDPKIETLMNLKISGIMYDEVRPSAILVVDNAEHLVHNGDMIMGYTIQKITKDKVIIRYQSNTYEVTAGQTLNMDGLHMNPVSSATKQFGGAY